MIKHRNHTMSNRSNSRVADVKKLQQNLSTWEEKRIGADIEISTIKDDLLGKYAEYFDQHSN